MIRQAVSKNRVRYVDNEFNLDLTYITKQIIVMSYPATGFAKLYRNRYVDVKKFLDQKHDRRYYVFNLCSEQEHQYDPKLFDYRAFCYPISDHNAPSIHLCCSFVHHAEQIINQSEQNVIVIHCKAGKGRTGLMCCCLLATLYTISGKHVTTEQILDQYNNTRTIDGRGITIPSQKRYIDYLHRVVMESFDPLTKKIKLYCIPRIKKRLKEIRTTYQLKKYTIYSNRYHEFTRHNLPNSIRFLTEPSTQEQQKICEFDKFNGFMDIELENEILFEIKGVLKIYFWIFQKDKNSYTFTECDIDWVDKKVIPGTIFDFIFEGDEKLKLIL